MQEPGMLIVIRGYNKGEIYKLGARNVTAGRDAGNLIQLIDKEVSRRHFLIRNTDKGYVLVDMNSANGTSVNGKAVRETPLELGDVIRAGRTYFKVLSNLGSVDDASLSAKVIDERIAAAPTNVSDVEEEWEQGGGVAPREIIDTVALTQQRISEMDKIFLQMQTEADFLTVSTEAIHRFICPDRTVVLKIVEGNKLRPQRIFYHPQLDRDLQQVQPAFSVVKQAIGQRGHAIDNKLDGAGADGATPATAMAVPIIVEGQALGAVYIDSFPQSRKAFMDFDSDLLNKIAALVGGRWRKGG